MRIVRRHGGPQAVADVLGLVWEGEIDEQPEHALGCDGGQDVEQSSPERDALCAAVWSTWDEAHVKAWRDAGSPEWAGPGMASKERAPVAPVDVPDWVRGAPGRPPRAPGAAGDAPEGAHAQAHKIPLPEGLRKRLQSFMDRNVLFLVEHHRTAREDDRYWVLWRLPQTGGNLDDVLKEADACSRQHPHHYVRVTAFDNEAQLAQFSAVLYAPSDSDKSSTSSARGRRREASQPSMAKMNRDAEEAYSHRLKSHATNAEPGGVQRWRLKQLEATVRRAAHEGANDADPRF